MRHLRNPGQLPALRNGIAGFLMAALTWQRLRKINATLTDAAEAHDYVSPSGPSATFRLRE
jgi:hypothetical protein